jgi:serine/threonine protein kinase
LAQVDSEAELTMTGELIGTLRYMSPEQLHGDIREVDSRTDAIARLENSRKTCSDFSTTSRFWLADQQSQIDAPRGLVATRNCFGRRRQCSRSSRSFPPPASFSSERLATKRRWHSKKPNGKAKRWKLRRPSRRLRSRTLKSRSLVCWLSEASTVPMRAK